jgi:cytochrome c peroxidase
VSSLTKRNSLQLNDIGWTNRMGFFWDMSQTNLQEMIKLPLKDANEVGADIPAVIEKLNDTEYYPELFANAYGDSEITEDRITDAISQFISSMVTFNSKRDKALSGEINFTQKEEEGMHIFEQTCGICHFEGVSFDLIGIDVFAFPFIFSNGLDKPGEGADQGMGEWMGEAFNGLFKIPTLRNIEKTGPYMHDGRFETLEEVVDFYSDEVEQTEWSMIPPPGFQFDDIQKENLVAFLKTFTDESFLTNPKWSDPFRDSNTSNIDELDFNNGILVSPNPFSNNTTIKFENDTNELIKIYLVNSSGQVVWKETTKGTEFQFQKDNLVPGMYFLDVVKSNKSTTVKVIAQ